MTMTPDRLREIVEIGFEILDNTVEGVERPEFRQACRALLAAIDKMEARTEREYAEATDRYRAALAGQGEGQTDAAPDPGKVSKCQTPWPRLGTPRTVASYVCPRCGCNHFVGSGNLSCAGCGAPYEAGKEG